MVSSRFAVSAVLAALFSSAAADLQIISPGGPNLWWVAQSINTLAWTCAESPFSTFTILVANAGQPAIAGGQAIIAIENNFDCSKTITADELNFPAGSGYTVQLANPLNNTDVYAVSQEFEIKPLGAAYPASSATPTLESTTGSSSATSTGSGSGTSTSPTTSATGNSAAGLKGSAAGIAAIAAAAFGVILA
ncbi:hypothetical protein EW026_g1479 [Hermanssonia centrifuga]|uniref:Uncharacterized protein n=1 Tax=Hermanssonia centrifuga TaxID=98765 RepID=A0A4S4KRB3_9APHY|nr:hypothetical protein EW026_g1479 [Hermanssonia centrifuga]